MTNKEFSEEFDVLVNSYANKIPFGEDTSKVNLAFDEYEKSVFLTRYQEELVISLYNGKNPYGDSFEKTEELRRYLSNLVVDDNPEIITNSKGEPLSTDKTHTFYQLKEDVWFITYESADVANSNPEKCGDLRTLEVVPVRQDEYHRLKKNPFRGANNRRVLRADLSEGVVELISKNPVSNYYVRYLRKPQPIVLEDFTVEGLEIGGKSEETPCELHEALHQKILEGAVRMAVASKGVGYKERKE